MGKNNVVRFTVFNYMLVQWEVPYEGSPKIEVVQSDVSKYTTVCIYIYLKLKYLLL